MAIYFVTKIDILSEKGVIHTSDYKGKTGNDTGRNMTLKKNKAKVIYHKPEY